MVTMNASRWNWTIIGLIGCALVLYGVSNPLELPHVEVGAVEPNYSLSFTESDNRFSTSGTETTDTAVTTAGSAISFTYSGLTQTAGTWETVAPGGYFYNTTPISGLKTISFAFGDANGISLSYGWQSSPGVNNYRVTGVALDSLTSSYAFQDERPNCFKIENTSGIATVSLTSFTLTYSCSANSDPYAGTDGLAFTLIGDTSYSVSGYTGPSTAVVIPSQHLGLPVTSIANFAFMNKTFTSITIPNSVTSIGGYVFWNCTSLTSVTISSGVTTFGDYAFYGCTSLTSITIPSNVTSIGISVFSGCTALTSIMIPSSVTSIGNSAFNGCTSLAINCQAASQPVGWDANWNISGCTVNWGIV